MAACIKANVEAGEPASGGGSVAGASGDPPGPATVVTAKPVNALGLFFQVLWSGVRRAFGAKTA